MSTIETRYRPVLDILAGVRRREPYVREIEEAGRFIVAACEHTDPDRARGLARQAQGAVGRAALAADRAGLRDGTMLRDIHDTIGSAAIPAV